MKPDTITTGLKLVLATQVLFRAATTLTKLSVLALVYRIVAEGSKRMPKFIAGAVLLIVVRGISFCFTVIF